MKSVEVPWEQKDQLTAHEARLSHVSSNGVQQLNRVQLELYYRELRQLCMKLVKAGYPAELEYLFEPIRRGGSGGPNILAQVKELYEFFKQFSLTAKRESENLEIFLKLSEILYEAKKRTGYGYNYEIGTLTKWEEV